MSCSSSSESECPSCLIVVWEEVDIMEVVAMVAMSLALEVYSVVVAVLWELWAA